eukprot:GHVR01065847.1.p1 GENE.GHVR01065847.1~~GHVR01065847.1.p1  ORF type:complete len:165 (-),score=20.31 GHVR01065847.1:150-644(-)
MDEQEAMQERFQLLPRGEYDAVIVKSEDKQSHSGNPMMDMTLHVYDKEGVTHPVRDFLVFTKSMMWKAIHCAESAGIIDLYKSGKLCSNIIEGKTVRIKLGIEEGKEIPEDKLGDRSRGDKYPDKNKVEDYVKNESPSSRQTAGGYSRPPMQQPLSNEEDDVPF